MKIIITFLVFGLVLILGGLAFINSGLYNFSLDRSRPLGDAFKSNLPIKDINGLIIILFGKKHLTY